MSTKPLPIPPTVKKAMRASRAAIDEFGQVAPVMCCTEANGETSVFVLTALFEERITSETRRTLLQTTLARAGATSYALVTESWFLLTPAAPTDALPSEAEARAAAGLAPGQSISEHPQRREVVVISFQDIFTHDIRCWQAFIHRHNDEVWLGEFDEVSQPGGLMVGLFDQPGWQPMNL